MSRRSHPSYPSPVSARPSPQALARGSQPGEPGNPLDASRNLRQVSASLDAVYQSIRQVRRSLAELQDYSFLPPRFPEVSIGPNHDAILLTEEVVTEGLPQAPEVDNDVTLDFGASWSSSFSQPPSLSPAEAISLPSIRSSYISTTSLNSPVSPPRNAHPTRRSLFEAPPRHGESEDPSTSIGRNVAARQANQPTLPDFSAQQRSMVLAEQSLRELDRLRSEYSRRLGMSDLPPVSEGPSMEPLLEYPRPSPAERLARRSLDAGVLQTINQPPPPTPGSQLMPPRFSAGGRRWPRLSRGDTRQNTIQSPTSTRSDSSRLSMLSNFPIANMATPPGILGRDRPLLFDEPASYAPLDLQPSAAPHRSAGRDSGRDPLMRGYLRPAGVRELPPQEYSHYINPLGALPSSRYVSDFISPDLLQEPRQPAMGSSTLHRTRRRGWARLDADGNEIPSDEEEELERMLAEQRVRVNNAAVSAFLDEPTTLTRSGPLMADGDDHIARWSQPRSYDRHEVLYTKVVRSTSPVPGSYRPKPFRPDPLPMPLDEMVPSAALGQPVDGLFAIKNDRIIHDR